MWPPRILMTWSQLVQSSNYEFFMAKALYVWCKGGLELWQEHKTAKKNKMSRGLFKGYWFQVSKLSLLGHTNLLNTEITLSNCEAQEMLIKNFILTLKSIFTWCTYWHSNQHDVGLHCQFWWLHTPIWLAVMTSGIKTYKMAAFLSPTEQQGVAAMEMSQYIALGHDVRVQ